MNKLFLVLFFLLVCSYLNADKADKVEEEIEDTESTTSDDDEDDSDSSIQVVQRDVVANQQEESLLKYNNHPHEEENYTNILPVMDTNTTQAKAKYDAFFEDLIGDSHEIPLEDQDKNIDEVLIPTIFPIEKNSEYNNGQDKMAIIFEDATKAYTHDEKSEEDSSIIEEDDWRSAENPEFGEKKYSNEAANENSSDEEFSVEDYMNKKIAINVKGRMETRHPERRPHYHSRPMNVPQYGQPEGHGMLDSDPMRRFGDTMVPRYRPVLTRSGIVYTPNLFPMQAGPSLLDRLSGRNWVPNRVHMNPEPEVYKARHSKVVEIPHYEDTKMMEDYNEYAPSSNTYSYTPARPVTTQSPPQQIVAPKFDVFQKLVEASNHPKSQKRTFDEFPGNYHARGQYSDSYGGYNVRRVRRNAWDEPPFKDI